MLSKTCNKIIRMYIACASARILLEETLRHKQQLYREQKRITTTTGEMNNDIIARIAAATLDSDNSIAEVKKASNSSLSKFQASKRRPKIRLLVHMNEHSEKITRYEYTFGFHMNKLGR